jgi:ubiquinone/menaquinone biosynthesis C-methylase UbiE
VNIIEEFAKLTELNLVSQQELKRLPEPSGITTHKESVNEYNKVLGTNMAANYAAGLELLWRTKDNSASTTALDLCCGPGHMSLFLKQHLGYQNVIGVDLSPYMIEIANQNANDNENSIKFQVGDVTKLTEFPSRKFDAILFSNSAHHFDRIEQVQAVLRNAERLISPRGIILLTDIGRLKTRAITEKFVELAGMEFKLLGMAHMYQDFYDSMFAAWTSEELSHAVPYDSSRRWVQMVPTGLSNYLALVSLPSDRSEIFMREGKNWEDSGILSSPGSKAAWPLLRSFIETAQFLEIDNTQKRNVG